LTSLVLPATRGKSIHLTEVWRLDDTGCRGFFLAPVTIYPRQYEARRAVCIAGRRLHDVAQQLGDRETSWRSLVCRVRAPVHAGEVPPLLGPPPGATSEAAARPHPRRPRADSRRCGARVEPGSRTAPAPARRGGGSLPALVGPCTLRAPGQPSPRSWRHDGARAQCVVARARPDAPGQSPAPPHQRLYLRRGWGLGCRPPWASPDLLRDRLRLSHRA